MQIRRFTAGLPRIDNLVYVYVGLCVFFKEISNKFECFKYMLCLDVTCIFLNRRPCELSFNVSSILKAHLDSVHLITISIFIIYLNKVYNLPIM